MLPPRLLNRLLPLVLLVAACAEMNRSGASPVRAEASSPLSIVLGPVSSREDATAQRMAMEHCAEHGLTARLPRMVGPSSVHYQCLD